MDEKTFFDSYLTDDNLVYLENETIRIGVNLSLGGALTYLAEKGKKNLINSYDWGRQVQMSFYSHPIPFVPEGVPMAERWKHIGWNPIQSGDVGKNRSRVLDWHSEYGEVYVKCIPMHWPLDNYPGECSFEVWYRLEGSCVNVTARLNNARPDKTQYPARRQELPAVYTNGEWYRTVSYVGKKPFTDDTVTELVGKNDGLGYPWLQFFPTENWSALLDETDYGLGICIGSTGFSKAGFWRQEDKGWGGPRDNQTGYIAPFAPEVLDHNIVYTYRYSLIVGKLDFIRRTACEKVQAVPRNKFCFARDRDHFYYKDITDKGLPTGGCLEFDFRAGSELKSPPLFYGKDEYQTVTLDACFDGEIIGEVVCRLYEGLDERHWGVRGEYTIPFTMMGDGRRAAFALDISSAPDCFIGFAIRFGCEGHVKVYGVELQ